MFREGMQHRDRLWAKAQNDAVQRIRDGIDKPVGWDMT